VVCLSMSHSSVLNRLLRCCPFHGKKKVERKLATQGDHLSVIAEPTVVSPSWSPPEVVDADSWSPPAVVDIDGAAKMHILNLASMKADEDQDGFDTDLPTTPSSRGAASRPDFSEASELTPRSSPQPMDIMKVVRVSRSRKARTKGHSFPEAPPNIFESSPRLSELTPKSSPRPMNVMKVVRVFRAKKRSQKPLTMIGFDEFLESSPAPPGPGLGFEDEDSWPSISRSTCQPVSLPIPAAPNDAIPKVPSPTSRSRMQKIESFFSSSEDDSSSPPAKSSSVGVLAAGEQLLAPPQAAAPTLLEDFEGNDDNQGKKKASLGGSRSPSPTRSFFGGKSSSPTRPPQVPWLNLPLLLDPPEEVSTDPASSSSAAAPGAEEVKQKRPLMQGAFGFAPRVRTSTSRFSRSSDAKTAPSSSSSSDGEDITPGRGKHFPRMASLPSSPLRARALLSLSSQEADEDEKAQTDGSDEWRGPRRLSHGSSKGESVRGAATKMGRHMHWRPSGVMDLRSSELLAKALDVTVEGKIAMHPERAKSGYKLLQSVKQLVENQYFDDSVGRSLVEHVFFDSLPRKHIEIKQTEQVLRLDLLKKFLTKVADEASSVEICWHGTQEKYVDEILEKGLNPNLCATGAYGRGAYVGTHSGVAHQYADPNEEGWRHMCCVLVVVGSSVVKGTEGTQSVATTCDRLVNPTQYCVVEQDRLYSSHLITYRVTKMHSRRTGGGWEDPFQRKLCSALSKAARNRNKSGLR